MPFPTRLIGIFALIFFIIVVIPMLFIGTREVASEKTEELGLTGLMEGMQMNITILIILVVIAVTLSTVWGVVIFNITPKKE